MKYLMIVVMMVVSFNVCADVGVSADAEINGYCSYEYPYGMRCH